jgi:hypothetical protein
MKMIAKYFLAVFFALCFGSSFSQTKGKSTSSLEYVSAAYDAVSNEVSISMKNAQNEVKQFLYSPSDQSQSETFLFNPINSLQGNSNILTKPELIGVKYMVIYNYIGSQQEGSTCCYKITSCVPE